jgi:hypothetical protein
MATKYMKKCSTSMAIKELQIKTTLRFNLTPTRMTIFKGKKATNAGKDEMKQELLYTVDGNAS